MPVPYPSGRIMWGGTHASVASIPGSWSRDTAFDGRFLWGDDQTYTGPVDGGNAEHTHTPVAHRHGFDTDHQHEFSAAAATGASSGTRGGGAADRPSPTHLHTTVTSEFPTGAQTFSDYDSTAFPAVSNDIAAAEMILIKPGDATQEVPDDAFCFTDETTLPTGYTKFPDGTWQHTYVKAPPTGGDGGSRPGRSSSHDHRPVHTHTFTETHPHAAKRCGTHTAPVGLNPVGVSLTRAPPHHMVSGDSAAAGDLFSATGLADGKSYSLPYIDMLGIFNTSGVAKTSTGIIIPYAGTPASVPAGWAFCDGSAGTPDLRANFIRLTSTDGEIGDTGGATTHQHDGLDTHNHLNATHTHTSSVTRDQETGCVVFGTPVTVMTYSAGNDNHLHVWTWTDVAGDATPSGIDSDASNHMPLQRTVIFIKRLAVSEQPSLGLGINF